MEVGKPSAHYQMLEEIVQRRKAEESFYEFVKQAWHIVEGNNPFVDGWAIGAICEHIEAVVRREIRFLNINIPPRMGKSSIVSVMLCAWTWIEKSNERFLYSSYSHNLSMRDSVRCRRVITSEWYQTRWGDRFELIDDQNTKVRYDNDRGGFRMSVSQNSSTTGEGGSILVTDDANAASDMYSDNVRESRNNWLDSTWSTRLNDPKTGCRINIQQRIHEHDATGHINANDTGHNYINLVLPMEFEEARRCKTIILPSSNGQVWTDPRTKEKELLFPERIGPQELEQLKSGLGDQYAISGQLQQNPAPAEGGMIKKQWFKWWKFSHPPKIDHVIQSWDTALGEKDKNCFSACTTWGLFLDDHNIMNLILLSLWRGKLEYPELRKMAVRLHNNYLDDDFDDPVKSDARNVPDVVLIEAKSSGISLIQDFLRAGIIATKFNPDKFGDKIGRVRLITHILENGRVWLPAKPPGFIRLRDYADLLMTQCSIFPAAESRDLVDTMTQAILRLHASGYLNNATDTELFGESNEADQTRRPYY